MLDQPTNPRDWLIIVWPRDLIESSLTTMISLLKIPFIYDGDNPISTYSC
jgi:hypothetical protein